MAKKNLSKRKGQSKSVPRKNNLAKELSNPYSSGGGGVNFETRVQTSFVVLMLTGGCVPSLATDPITKIKLQAKANGYNTDDFVVFTKNTQTGSVSRLLAQVKHTITISESDTTFAEVIHQAWSDFRDPKKFLPKKDNFALVTGPISAKDIDNTRTILEWARHTEDASEFIRNVELAYFSNVAKRQKLKAFRKQLKRANKGVEIEDGELHEFLKCFHLLGFDLDVKAGVSLALLHSLISQCAEDNANSIWSQLLYEIQSFNQNAGTISRDSISMPLVEAFARKKVAVIPDEFSKPRVDEKTLKEIKNPHVVASAGLAGKWDEKNPNDQAILEMLTGQKFQDLIQKMRENL
ncbi:hypothetical protein Q31b_12430 [Novipirellula aureliae]|uniref:Uncharacterized protein n=1 Tax=Novipirellula aureliae TaxID=2527966 RepID=A0A5C6E5C3_9BACT|nr:hypothetical protein [Novipirellula aureliae]TWU43714.1 hypothetical protein Q31b_12430 [Novipirellula aureliae]